ncbi:MAG TPA: ISNCY family transposase [Herpetosiphonaceae bacterium]|nr:ISNCY family transposase [Herpetosiphonaceae bacterium]
MLRDRYEPLNLFALVPTLGMALEPVLARLDSLLDDDTLFQAVKADLARRRPRTRIDGRPSTPVEVILRMLVVKHLYGWSYEQTEQWVADSLVLRQFCRVYAERVPDDTTLIRWANLIQPATLHALLDHIVGLAQQLKVTRGRKLRIDGTVVETNIHHPTDSTLLHDGVRVLSRTLTKAKQILQDGAPLAHDACRDRTRSAKRQMKRIMEAARQRGEQAEQAMRGAYRRLLDIAQAMRDQAQRVGAALREQATAGARRVADALDQAIPLVEQVIAQTTRRVLHGETVPAGEKIVSLFEPHTAIIRKGKPGRPTQFGRVLWLDEVEGGLITRYELLEGNPPEPEQLPPSLDHHRRVFAHPPRLLAGDRGIHSPANERYATAQGVRQVVLPKPGAKSAKRIAHEQQRWFRRGHDWRSGLEGRISGLKRRHKLDRCRYHGDAGMERWVGWGLIAHDLRAIATATAR